MTRANRIEAALKARFSPSLLEVHDESHFHAGHAGASPLGETHYRVDIKSEAFKGLTRVAMHRAVNEAVKGEFDKGLHALAIKASF
jgi:BolA family transcriptional regulator, general stress-responsive regulator